MPKSLILLLFSFFSLSYTGFSQADDCKVLLNGLNDIYTGDCKKGLANGQGTATGELGKYVGEFKKGLPNGIGKLEYSRSNAYGSYYKGEWSKGLRNGKGRYFYPPDSIVDGYWERGTYIGAYPYPYKVIVSRGLTRTKITRVADSPNLIEVQFKRNGIRTMDDIVSIATQFNSGSQLEQQNYIGFEQVVFPFEGRFILTLNNKLRTNTFTAEFEYAIYREGRWLVSIEY
jgi:MORN repeat